MDFSYYENRGVQLISFGPYNRYLAQPKTTCITITDFGPPVLSIMPIYHIESGTMVEDFTFYPLSTRYITPEL